MTSQLNVDTIVDKAGSGGTNVKIANNSVTVSEGGSATTTTVQGLLKHFATIQGTDTFATIDSFNQSSATDNGTGDHSTTYTNNMDEARVPRTVYTHNTTNEGSSESVPKERGGTMSSGNGAVAPTTSAFRFKVLYGSNSSSDGNVIDLSYVYMMTSGDLA
jgi:hypothetical protein